MILPLRSVEVENFRGIRRMKLDLHPQVTVLFGANAAGKTTILDALAIALGAIVARVPKVSGRRFTKAGDELRIPWKTRPDVGERGRVPCHYARVTARNGGVNWDVTHLRSQQDRRSVPLSLGTSHLNEALDSLILEALNAEPRRLTRPIPFVAAYGTERAVVEVPLRQRGFAKEFQRFGAFDGSLQVATRFKAVFEWFRLMEDEERREGQRVRDLDFKLPALEWVRRALERANLHCHRPRVETHPLRMLVDFEHGDGSTEVLDISALSDGYRTHFALVVDLARRMAQLNPSGDLADPERGTNSRAAVLIDEIDLHLDPQWQGAVLVGLRAAFPNTQFVVTTHSEQVLGSVDKECVRKLVWGDGEILVEDVPFAQGATGERILMELMDAPERVPGPVTDTIREFEALVSAGGGKTPRARELRASIAKEVPHDPALLAADSEIRRQELLKKLGGHAP